VNTNVAKPAKVAIIGASGRYGKGILARAEEIGVEAVVVTRSPHKFRDVKPTTTVVEAQLDEEEKLREAFTGCDGVISALGDDRKKRPKSPTSLGFATRISLFTCLAEISISSSATVSMPP